MIDWNALVAGKLVAPKDVGQAMHNAWGYKPAISTSGELKRVLGLDFAALDAKRAAAFAAGRLATSAPLIPLCSVGQPVRHIAARRPLRSVAARRVIAPRQFAGPRRANDPLVIRTQPIRTAAAWNADAMKDRRVPEIEASAA